MGATQSVDWEYVENTADLIQKLKKQSVETIAIEQAEDSLSLKEYQPNKNQKTAMILGNEVKGVSQKVVDLCDQVLEIPQYGTKHSLNISVTAGICIWDYFANFNQ